MVELKNLVVDELECGELRANHITCESINGVTAEELNCLRGVTSNIQDQIDALNAEYDALIASWS